MMVRGARRQNHVLALDLGLWLFFSVVAPCGYSFRQDSHASEALGARLGGDALMSSRRAQNSTPVTRRPKPNATFRCGGYRERFGVYVELPHTDQTCNLSETSAELRAKYFNEIKQCVNTDKLYWGRQLSVGNIPQDIRVQQARILEHLNNNTIRQTIDGFGARWEYFIEDGSPYKVPSDDLVVQVYTERSGATQFRAPNADDKDAIDYYTRQAPAKYAVVDYVKLVSSAIPGFGGDRVADAISHRFARDQTWIRSRWIQDRLLFRQYRTNYCLVKAFFANPPARSAMQPLRLQGIELRCQGADPVYHSPGGRGWDYAKAMLMSNYLWMNHVVYHLAYEHLLAETIGLSMYDYLSADHWVFRLLSPMMADAGLINQVWGLDEFIFGITGIFPTQDTEKVKSLIEEALKQYPGEDQFDLLGFLRDPRRSGVESHTVFPFRDIGKTVWDSWYKFVGVVVEQSFSAADMSLSAWWKGKFFWEDEPEDPPTKETLVRTLTNVLWLSTYRHDYNHDHWITHSKILQYVPARLIKCEWMGCWSNSRALADQDGVLTAEMPDRGHFFVTGALAYALHNGVLETPLEAYLNPKYGFTNSSAVMGAYNVFLDDIFDLLKRSHDERRTSGDNPYPVFASFGSLTH